MILEGHSAQKPYKFLKGNNPANHDLLSTSKSWDDPPSKGAPPSDGSDRASAVPTFRKSQGRRCGDFDLELSHQDLLVHRQGGVSTPKKIRFFLTKKKPGEKNDGEHDLHEISCCIYMFSFDHGVLGISLVEFFGFFFFGLGRFLEHVRCSHEGD